jgi:hypothetical protein
VAAVASESGINVEVVKRSDLDKGFVVQAWRWIVERTLGWLNRERRLSKAVSCSAASPDYSSSTPPQLALTA